MKVIMTGGGTGGHIYPAIAVARKIQELKPGTEILFVGTQRGLEKDLVPKNGYPIEFITVSGFHRKNLLKNGKTLRDLVKGIHEAGEILRRFQPDAVIGTGGYVCGPVVREAAKMGIPAYIHEQNAFPGVTNKLLARYVRRIFLAFPAAAEYFRRYSDKLTVTGNPVRREFFEEDRSGARKRLGIPENRFVLLSFGGSQGAGRINDVLLEALPRLLEKKEVLVLFATGRYYYHSVLERLENAGISPGGNLHVLEYISDMADHLMASDLVVSRSGALTVAEITTCGRAAVLVPSPNVTGNHQYYNAKAIEEKGGAFLIEDKDFTAERLLQVTEMLKSDRSRLTEMESASRRMAAADAAGKIAEEILADLAGAAASRGKSENR